MKNNHEIKMMTPFTVLLLLVIALGVILMFYRLVNGLGAATNLNDDFPWGLWIGFDLLGGVAMAGKSWASWSGPEWHSEQPAWP